MERIASFTVDHTVLEPGLYLSRRDGNVVTFDLRFKKPNTGDLLSNSQMHSVEHLIATLLRNSQSRDAVVYFGPMGCQTGFYLLMRDADHEKVLREIERVLEAILAYDGEIFGKSRKECGNYINLDLELAKAECRRYLKAVKGYPVSGLAYPKGEER